MDNKVETFNRPRLDPARIEGKLAQLGCSWAHLVVRDSVTSTNDEVLAFIDLATEHQVVVLAANEQVAGRGRLARAWSSPAGTCVAMSVLVPVRSVQGHVGAIPLRTGLAAVNALEALGFSAQIKWPNDIVVLHGDELAKLGGILVQLHADHVVIGIGLNVDLAKDQLPIATATSLAIEGSALQREEIIAHIVAQLEKTLMTTEPAWLDRYRQVCVTIGAQVQVTVVDGSVIRGTVENVSDDGQLLLNTGSEVVMISVGDVEHIRPMV